MATPTSATNWLKWRPGQRKYFNPLTATQLQILSMTSRGYTPENIAVVMGITPSSIRTQLQRLRARFKAKNTTQLVADMLRKGYII